MYVLCMYPLFLLSIVNIFIWIYMHGHQAQWNIYETMGICSHLHTSGRPYSNREVRLCPTNRPVPSWFKNDPPGLDFSAHWLKEASLKLLAGSKWSVALHDTWNKMQTPTLALRTQYTVYNRPLLHTYVLTRPSEFKGVVSNSVQSLNTMGPNPNLFIIYIFESNSNTVKSQAVDWSTNSILNSFGQRSQ